MRLARDHSLIHTLPLVAGDGMKTQPCTAGLGMASPSFWRIKHAKPTAALTIKLSSPLHRSYGKHIRRCSGPNPPLVLQGLAHEREVLQLLEALGEQNERGNHANNRGGQEAVAIELVTEQDGQNRESQVRRQEYRGDD